MIQALSVKRAALPLFILVLLSSSLACNTLTGGSGEVPDDKYPQEITIEQNIVYGSGPFEFPEPQVGLSDLSSYKATLTLAFDGTRDGRTEKWSKIYVMLTTRDPAVRQLTIEKSGDIPDPTSAFLAELDGADYEKSGEQACETTAIPEGNSLADRFEPVLFLDGVIGADEAGSETVNDVASDKYTFDQRALGEDEVTESTGELWVASEGGYLIKYVLTRKAKADYFGEGVEGTLTLDYELTDINIPAVITLPDDCPPGFVDAPLLPDASTTTNIPGVLAFDTSSTIAEAAAFYQQNIPDLGWEAQEEPSVTDAIAILNYKKGDKVMFIIIKPSDASTEVRIMVSKAQESLIP